MSEFYDKSVQLDSSQSGLAQLSNINPLGESEESKTNKSNQLMAESDTLRRVFDLDSSNTLQLQGESRKSHNSSSLTDKRKLLMSEIHATESNNSESLSQRKNSEYQAYNEFLMI